MDRAHLAQCSQETLDKRFCCGSAGVLAELELYPSLCPFRVVPAVHESTGSSKSKVKWLNIVANSMVLARPREQIVVRSTKDVVEKGAEKKP